MNWENIGKTHITHRILCVLSTKIFSISKKQISNQNQGKSNQTTSEFMISAIT